MKSTQLPLPSNKLKTFHLTVFELAKIFVIYCALTLFSKVESTAAAAGVAVAFPWLKISQEIVFTLAARHSPIEF